MARPEKVQAVAEIKDRLESAGAVFLAEYAGLSVKQQQSLRRSLKEQGAEFKVVKMTLARRAAAELDIGELDDLLLGPTGLTFTGEDVVPAAKALKDFARSHEVFRIKGGLVGSEFLTPERVSELADIEPREVLLAKLAGLTQAPSANLLGLTSALLQNTATLLQQLVDKRQAEEGHAEPEVAATEEGRAEPAAEAADIDAAAAAGSDAEPASVSDDDAEPNEDEEADEASDDAGTEEQEEDKE